MNERADILERTELVSLRVIWMYSALPEATESRVEGKQVLRSGTSVGAHVGEAKRSRSRAEMISKTDVALQELEEAIDWMELLVESVIVKARRLFELIIHDSSFIIHHFLIPCFSAFTLVARMAVNSFRYDIKPQRKK